MGAGLSIIPIYQDGGEYSGHFSRSRGKADAENAYVAAKALGIPDESIIYFAVDFDAMGNDLDNILAYFDEIIHTLKDYYVGIYGTRNICATVLRHGGAFKCYVSDMSTGYSGNLGYRMPDFWAFDQFATTTVAGVEIDKVACSGEDTAVKFLWEPDVTSSEYTDMALNAAVHSKICDFQEDFPTLLVPVESGNSSGDEPVFVDLISGLPNVAYTMSWKKTLVKTPNLRVDYELGVGASTAHEGDVMTISVSNGTISFADYQKISDAITASQSASAYYPITPGQATNLFKGLANSIKFGSIAISISGNPANNEITVALTCNIPNLEVTDDMTVNFSQTLSVWMKGGDIDLGTNVYPVPYETMNESLNANNMGNVMAVLYEGLCCTAYTAKNLAIAATAVAVAYLTVNYVVRPLIMFFLKIAIPPLPVPVAL